MVLLLRQRRHVLSYIVGLSRDYAGCDDYDDDVADDGDCDSLSVREAYVGDGVGSDDDGDDDGDADRLLVVMLLLLLATSAVARNRC